MQNVTYRKALPGETEKYLDFANLVFSNAHNPHDFRALIPKVYGEGVESAHIHNIAIRDDGSIRGMVAVMPNTLRIGDTVLKTGFIGTVSVHPYARSEGHMKKLMAMAIEGMEQDGVDLAMLGGQRQRYEYFGFNQAGLEISHHITSTNVRHALRDTDTAGIAIFPAEAEDMAACAALHDTRAIAAARPADAFAAIARTWSSTLRVIRKDGVFAGYLIGSGGRLQELMLADWDLTLPVVKYLTVVEGEKDIRLSTGAYEVELNRRLAVLEEGISAGHCEMYRVFNFPRVIGALMTLQSRLVDLPDGRRSFIIDGKPMTVTVEGGVPRVTEEAEEGAVELTAMQAQKLFLGIDGALLVGRLLPTGWAPLPLYMSHTDGF